MRDQCDRRAKRVRSSNRCHILVSCLALAACANGANGVNHRELGDTSTAVVGDGGVAASDSGPPLDCVNGTMATCVTSCGSIGTTTCMAGHSSACAVPVEECNGMDDDCDGTTDEDQSDRACTSSCGGGTSQCIGGVWSACMGGTPQAETCDGTDQDCDGMIDDGLSRACMNACGAGMETCNRGVWQGCNAPTPRLETCDGVDQDCNGMIDDGLVRACSSACGSGTESCTRGAWMGCTAPAPAPESCNLVDDDCDGTVDNGFEAQVFDAVSFAALYAEQPACTGPSARLDFCATAARRWCTHDLPCFTAGGVLVQVTGSNARVVCFDASSEERVVSFAAVIAASSLSLDESNIGTRAASAAVNRYCESEGFGAGVGPTEHSSSSMTLTCIPAEIAQTVALPTSELNDDGCDPMSAADSLACATAAGNACVRRGHAAGYGPVEWNETIAAVVCFR